MTLANGDLTTLAAAKAYLTNAPSDAVLSGLITRISRMIQGTLNRSLLVPKTYTEQYNGTGTQMLVLPHWPLTTLTSLKISGVLIPIAPQLDDVNSPPPNVPFGYRFQPWNGLPPGNPAVLELVGYWFYGGHQNVVISYKAGYEVLSEAQTIPASSAFTITPAAPFGSWATDEGVINATTGVAFTAVASAPSVGQYVPPSPDAASPVLVYTFNSADASTPVMLNYGFIPSDLEQVVLEVIAERASYRNRIGIRSQVLASQETIVYENAGLSRWVIDAIMPYVSVLPPAIGASV